MQQRKKQIPLYLPLEKGEIKIKNFFLIPLFLKEGNGEILCKKEK